MFPECPLIQVSGGRELQSCLFLFRLFLEFKYVKPQNLQGIEVILPV